jgi:predicted sulfurtransferase
MHCGIVELAHVDDAAGYPCGRDASTICLDCGTHLCDAHAYNCEVCSEVFCATCLAFHNRANHQKKDALWAEIAEKMKKKSA